MCFCFASSVSSWSNVLPCRIGSTACNCQPKWLRTRTSAAVLVLHEEKYFDCWYYHVERRIAKETNVKNLPQSTKVGTAETMVFSFLLFLSSSVFSKPIYNIFIGFHTSLVETHLLRLINIVLLCAMHWQSINNLIKYLIHNKKYFRLWPI